MRNLLDWSDALLTPREQRLFARLGVFAGSWDLDGAAAVQEAADAAGPEEVGALGRYWLRGRSLVEGRRWLEAALERAEGYTVPRAKALIGAGLLVADMNDYDRAETLAREALDVYEMAEDRAGRAAALVGLGGVAFLRGDFVGARRRQEEALALYRDLGDLWGTADTLYRLGGVHLEPLLYAHSVGTSADRGPDRSPGSRPAAKRSFRADLAPLADILGESHTLFALVGDRWGVAVALTNLAILAFLQAQDDRARMFATEGLTRLRDLGETMMTMRYLR